MSNPDLNENTKEHTSRSPAIKVAYNRKNAKNVGSLSPEFIRKLNERHPIDDDKEVLSQGSRRKKKEMSHSGMSLAIPIPYKAEEVARPKQTVTSDTLRGVLE